MIALPPGSFLMGSPEHEEWRDDDEGPQHEVKIVDRFALGKYEVTRAQFDYFVTATGYIGDHDEECGYWKSSKEGWVGNRNWDWSHPGYEQNDNHPVVCVNWDDAQAYVKWLRNITGEDYRLPSEAEWEYAARGWTKTRYFRGENAGKACQFANVLDSTDKQLDGVDRTKFSCEENETEHTKTAPVGSYPANAFGLHDMTGNVWEWVEDSHQDSYEGTPIDGSAWTGDDNAQRVSRGSSWAYGRWGQRIADRRPLLPNRRGIDLGFRIAKTLSD